MRPFLAVVAWMALIFAFSHQPSANIPDFGSWDLPLLKGAHMVAYGVLALLARRAIGRRRGATLWALALAVAYAVSDEVHQTFVPGRSGQPLDVLIDALGAVTALWLAAQQRPDRASRPQSQ